MGALEDFFQSLRPNTERVYRQALRRLLEAGYSDREVARALGHSTTQQVGVYDKRRREADDSPARDITY